MAKSNNILGLQGTIGGIVFKKNGTVSQKPASKGKENMSARTKENMSEFGKSATAGKKVRSALAAFVADMITSATGQITKVMRNFVDLDTINTRGERVIIDANVTGLAGAMGRIFNNSLEQVLRVNPSLTIGATSASIAFNAGPGDIVAPEGATHVRAFLQASSFRFELPDNATIVNSTTAYSPIGSGVPVPNPVVWANVVDTQVLVVAGLEFAQLVNGVFYKLGSSYYMMDSTRL